MRLSDAFRPNRSVAGSAWLVLVSSELALLALAWMAGSRFLIPGPAEVASAWLRLVQEEGLLYELLAKSLVTNLQAVAISTALSVGLAWSTVLPVFRPVVALLTKARFLGMTGLSVVFTMAFGGGHGLKVSLLVFGMSVFYLTSMASVVGEIPKAEFDHARSLRMSEWRTVYEVVVLGRAAEGIEVLRQNAAIGWMMLTMVEGLVRSDGGIGAMMLNENKHFRLDAVFAGLLTVGVVGAMQDHVIVKVRDLLCPYYRLRLERERQSAAVAKPAHVVPRRAK